MNKVNLLGAGLLVLCTACSPSEDQDKAGASKAESVAPAEQSMEKAKAVAKAPAEAEQERSPEKQAMKLERMQAELGLSPEQVAEIVAIQQSGGGSKKVNEVLTQEQRDTREAIQLARKADVIDRMQEELGLSDEQVSQIDAIGKEGGGMKEIRDVLTPEQLASWKELRKEAAE